MNSIRFLTKRFSAGVILLMVGLCVQISEGKKHEISVSQRPPLPPLDTYILPETGKPITIFVHGGAKPVSCLVALPGLYTSCPYGFVPYRSITSGCSTGKFVCEELDHAAPDLFPLETAYVFGWSGYLSCTVRQRAGEQLYDVISRLRSDERFMHSPITIITHSHGGNVALNIARAARMRHDERPLVDRLIITACPVGFYSQGLVDSPVFKQVFSFFSRADFAQVLDLQGSGKSKCCNNMSGKTFSWRRFDPSPNLIQVEMRINNRAVVDHLGFVSKYFLRTLPVILDMLTDPKKRKQLTKDKYGCYCLSISCKTALVTNACLRNGKRICHKCCAKRCVRG